MFLSASSKAFKLVVLVIFHLLGDTNKPTAVGGNEEDTKEGEEGIGDDRLV